MQLQYAEHHVHRLEYHLVWIPKYRKKVFTEPYRTTLKTIIQKVAYDYNIQILELEIPPDHIHLLTALEPKMSVSDAIRILKSITAREFFRHHPDIRKKYFWGGKLWTPSYYAETVGKRDEAAVQKYIQQQLEIEDKAIQQLSLFS